MTPSPRPDRDWETTVARDLGSLHLGDGLAARVMQRLPAGAPEAGVPGARAARGLLAAALALAAGLAAVFVHGWRQAAVGEPLLWLPEAAATGGCLLVGLLLALGARRLSEWDCRVIARLTGRVTAASAVDVALVRAGALAILAAAMLWRLPLAG